MIKMDDRELALRLSNIEKAVKQILELITEEDTEESEDAEENEQRERIRPRKQEE